MAALKAAPRSWCRCDPGVQCLLTSLLSFNPTLVASNVGTDPITLGGLLRPSPHGGAKVNGNSPPRDHRQLPVTPGDTGNSWIALFKKVHDTHDAKAPFDGNGPTARVRRAFVQAMVKAGRTRPGPGGQGDDVPQGASVAPYDYSATDHGGMMGAFIGVIKNGAIVQQGPVWTTDTTQTGPVTQFSGSQPAAPASGMP